jgi:hypothetical protein
MRFAILLFVALATSLVITSLGCGRAPVATHPAQKKPAMQAVSNRPAATLPQVQQGDFASVDDALGQVSVLVKSGDTNIGVQLVKIETWLEMQGPSIEPQLAAKIKDTSGDLAIRLTACRVLSKLGPIAVPTLLAAIESEPRQLRLKATECLGRVKPPEAKSVARLLKLIDDKDFEQRKAAIGALANMGPAAKEATPKLISLLNNPDEDETIRSSAKFALKHVDPRKGLMDAH